ncbi:hypothetical protein KP509_05G012000 [Ceratopteris richardii]|uniref:Sulfotransferase n=1 Tax=Ceratopteris richardii TaxID=49495 RepID=A0A8T2URR6_CERRI|nr:hypothetical protein KP509_05G012000 [Ceratopteris richardii]KAH7436296.1 hypothetical protein KP509_05G012000 [Ceratopteris richardii]
MKHGVAFTVLILVPFLLFIPEIHGEKKGLRVILCGFSRTGTMSLMTALDMLGFPCFHGSHLAKPSTGHLFLRAFKYGNPKDWNNLLDGYAAIADFPAVCSYQELMKIYPDAKVILNIRDPDRWYNSFSETIPKNTHGSERNIIFKLLTPLLAHYVQVGFYDKFLCSKPQDREICVRAFQKHISEVIQHVSPANLLIYDIEKEKGWNSLCAFLNVSIPDIPFPRVNERKAFETLVNSIATVHSIVLLLYIACFISILLCIIVYM